MFFIIFYELLWKKLYLKKYTNNNKDNNIDIINIENIEIYDINSMSSNCPITKKKYNELYKLV